MNQIINPLKSFAARILTIAILAMATIGAQADALDDAEAAIPLPAALSGLVTAIFLIVGVFVLIKLGKRGAGKV